MPRKAVSVLPGLADLGRGRDFNKRTCLHVVDVAVDRDVLRYKRVFANLPHILHHAFCKVRNRLEVDVAGVCAVVLRLVVPSVRAERRRIQAVITERVLTGLVNVSILQSLWWITNHSCVPRSLWEMMRERIVSSFTLPPALRITCASPSASPANFAGSSLASMHVTMAKWRPGGMGNLPFSPKSFW